MDPVRRYAIFGLGLLRRLVRLEGCYYYPHPWQDPLDIPDGRFILHYGRRVAMAGGMKVDAEKQGTNTTLFQPTRCSVVFSNPLAQQRGPWIDTHTLARPPGWPACRVTLSRLRPNREATKQENKAGVCPTALPWPAWPPEIAEKPAPADIENLISEKPTIEKKWPSSRWLWPDWPYTGLLPLSRGCWPISRKQKGRICAI